MANTAVNVPVDDKQKEKDINYKLQLYGIYSAFANGKLPSNKQIDVALNSALVSKALASPSNELSAEGKVLVRDLREVIEQAKLQVLVKNEGNMLQDFIYDAAHIDASSFTAPSAPIDKETAKQHGTEAKEGFKTLGTLLVTNGQFRKLLTDATVLLRDIAGDTAQKAAGSVKPSEEQLSQLDQPAEDSIWHEKPELSKDQIKSQMKSQYDRYKPAKSQKEAADEIAGATKTDGGAAAGTQKAKEIAEANVPEEAKETSRNTAERTKNYLNEKVPQERRDQTIYRMKKMIVEIQGHSDYQQAIETLLTLAENYAGHGREMSQQGTQTVKGARTDTGLNVAETNLRTLIERAANCTSLDDLIDSINTIYRDADKDPELRGWFRSINTFIRKCLREQGFILQEAADQQWQMLYDQGNFLMRDRYRLHTNRIVDELKFIGQQFDEDPQNKALARSLEQLFKHLGQDEQGKPAFKQHLLKDIGNVIIPGIFENVRYIPIPRIEVSDPMIDVVVENIVIEGDNLMPNVCEFGSDNYWRWGRKKISNKNDNKIMISASGIQTDMRDVSYYIKKKQGFPSITDTGVMDILLGGEGFGFKIAASTVHKTDAQHFFKIDNISVDVKNLDIKLKKSKHKFIFAMIKPLLFRVVRPAVEKVLQTQIRESFKKADGFAYEVHTEAHRQKDAARTDEEKQKSIYAYYADVTRKKMAERKEKAEKAPKRDTKTQVAVTEDDSIFKDIKLPGGISHKATEFKKLGEKGDRWTSPVFSIGSSSETTTVPKLGRIVRKPHTTSGGTLSDGATNGVSAARTNGTRTHGYADGFADGVFKSEVNHAFHPDGAQLKDTVGTTIPGTRAPINSL